MFGMTSRPSQKNPLGRVMSNSHEEIRRGATSTTYDTAAAERMKIDYLKKEKSRREKERNKLVYDAKKRDYDRLVDENERSKIEVRRLEAELVKYAYDVEGVKMRELRELSELPNLKKEELDLVQKIQKTEAELLAYKNKHQRVIQQINQIGRADKEIIADMHKREAYLAGVKTKYDTVKSKFDEGIRQSDKLKIEVDQLKRLIG